MSAACAHIIFVNLARESARLEAETALRPKAGLTLGWILPLVLAYTLTAPALARNCTATEKANADAQLWLNTRDQDEALATQLPWGLPQPNTDRLLIQRDYVIGYSDTLRVPLWTAHRLDAARLNKVSRVDCFRRDPRIPAPAASLPSDFDEPIYDQGHLTPNGDMSMALTPVINSFVLSNMAPQHCQFNRGVWQILESLTRIWADELGPLDVITGSVFDRNGDSQRDNDDEAPKMTSRNRKTLVAVPSHFYKVLVHRRDATHAKVLALLLPNDKTDLDGAEALDYLERHRVSVSDIEKLTGLTLLPKIGTVNVEPAPALWPHGKPAARSLAQRCAP